MSFKFHRGEYLRDMITGFSGVVVARIDNLTGCNRYCLQPRVDKDGKLIDSIWIDEPTLDYDPEHIAGERVVLARTPEQPPG